MRIYTKKGDTGETGLLFGGRLSKTDPKFEACGTADEAISAMGLARALSQEPRVKEVLLQVQREMFTVGSELATAPEKYKHFQGNFSVVTADMVERLENIIDELNSLIDLPSAFIIPGASPGSGALDLARTLLRTCERRVVTLHEQGLLVNHEVLRYVNRLSDLLFMLARYEDRKLPIELVTGTQE
jgi:cob(I)alamin adenosyltransferase